MTINHKKLPTIIAGPMVRKAMDNQLVLWLVTSQYYQCSVTLYDEEGDVFYSQKLTGNQHASIAVGKHAVINLLNIALNEPLIENTWVSYDIVLESESESFNSANLKDLCYEGFSSPRFWYSKQANHVLHGSCRKPHHQSEDALLAVDKQIAKALKDKTTAPSLLMLSGDQVYIDDVAGPMLSAIHQVISLLGLHSGKWQNTNIENNEQLLSSPNCYYQRDKILPLFDDNNDNLLRFFKGKKKRVFTSVSAHNHLISFAEVIAMYLLVWSPELWQCIEFDQTKINKKHRQKFQEEQQIINTFAKGLWSVRRALAHTRTFMIHDDHDITDDWNLTREWEEIAYGHPFSKRIIGNALIGYWLCQGWGNQPEVFDNIYQQAQECFSTEKMQNIDELIDTLLHFNHWHYSINTTPKMVVLDTRTQRWRSERKANRPSGLMDWEALTDLQHELFEQQAVLLVSPAPIFGVKLIEVIQKTFTFFGFALTVDAENWMAHKGTASVILNIFKHSKTPPNFIILSGDVHYSFVYDITLKHRKQSPLITQVTCSGIKNEFPKGLLNVLAKCNHYLYSSKSPLNWFTKRRDMLIKARRVDNKKILNQSGIGLIDIDSNYRVTAKVITADMKEFLFASKDNQPSD
ncbi:alkaline phosphatase D family protein [Colwellia sp. KU-HH00111]|uniref:alkaline phosphatase family protein n=1 Tax=Colwellia sp. KU-HH00111 TaxID=3127652 RepID=UPI0031090E73